MTIGIARPAWAVSQSELSPSSASVSLICHFTAGEPLGARPLSVTAVDWPAVLEVAKENAQKFGVADRYSVRPGSAFDTDLGSGYDYVFITNFLHHFDIPTNEQLLRRFHSALKPGGKAITVEFVPNEDRVSPPMAAAFSMVMLINTDAGDAYTFAEYESMCRNAGFKSTVCEAPPDLPQRLVIAEK